MAAQRLLEAALAPVEAAQRRGELASQRRELRIDGDARERRIAHVLRGRGAVTSA